MPQKKLTHLSLCFCPRFIVTEPHQAAASSRPLITAQGHHGFVREQDKGHTYMLPVGQTTYLVQEFVSRSIARWVAASDETQKAVVQLNDSKELISRFSNAVASRSCASLNLEGF
jgi:hypothetical protein